VGGVNPIYPAEDRHKWQDVLNTVMKLWVSKYARNFFMCWETISFSRKPLLHEV